jgi:predicted ATPase/class 3 adenylate cyclase
MRVSSGGGTMGLVSIRVGPTAELRTVLFTDIEGSTVLLRTLGDTYASILETHRILIRSAVLAHGGTEHSTGGDSFFITFPSAREGLAAALDAQVGLARHSWPDGVQLQVRMGLHAGEIEWAHGDAVGLAIHEAARIASAAHGGQIVVSSVLVELVAGALTSGVQLRSLGHHRLKDFDEPVELLQVLHPELADRFPPLRTASSVLEIPRARTSFVGREAPLASVLKMLADQRLVTLTGVGGAGKTRLALEAATRDEWRYRDGVSFVDLAPVADPSLVMAAIATSVRVQGEPADVEAMVLGYLADRQCLIILDNCEHLIDACAEAADKLLSGCRFVSILATSREALQVEGEHTFRVPSLDADGPGAEAVELFVARAEAVSSDLALDEAGLERVAAICRRLDGIPLAIELAASRLAHVSLDELGLRLDERFALLVGGGRRRVQRQATLQATMDWSWDLLGDQERAVLGALAVFAGPFDLVAAEAVCGVRPVIEPIASLVAKSLISLVDWDAGGRYRLLETVRLYALDRLVESGEVTARRDAHRDWYLARLEATDLDTLTDLAVVGDAILDFPNYRAALDWSTEQGRTDLFARMVLGGAQMWEMSPALIEETARLLHLIIDNPAQPAEYRANASALMSDLCTVTVDLPAMTRYAEAALEDASPPFRAMALMGLMRLDEAAETAEAAGLPLFARTCRSWAAATLIGNDPAAALRALDALRSLPDPAARSWNQRWCLIGSALARLALDDGVGALADACTLEDVERGNEAWGGSMWLYGSILHAMALGHTSRRQEARAVLRQVSEASLRDHYPVVAHDCLAALAYLASRDGDWLEAARLLEPVVSDARIRMFPMYFFVARLLADITRQLDGADAPLPSVTAFYEHAISGIPADPEAAARIERELTRFVLGQGG